MKFEVTKIILLEDLNPSKVEVHVSFNDEAKFFKRVGNVRIYLDGKNYTISKVKTEAIKAAKEFISELAQTDT